METSNSQTSPAFDPTSNDLLAFIAACEKLLLEHATPRDGFVNGHRHPQARTFSSPGLRLASTPDGEFEITVCYRHESGQVIRNPVVMRAAGGKIYRDHGEWRLGRRRLARLLAGERPVLPIALGPCPQFDGMTCGID